MSANRVRHYKRLCTCHPDTPETMEFNIFHAASCGEVLEEGGISREAAEKLVNKWNKAANGVFSFELED